jgi:hypothetical protein
VESPDQGEPQKKQHLGNFSTKEDAAAAYAREFGRID